MKLACFSNTTPFLASRLAWIFVALLPALAFAIPAQRYHISYSPNSQEGLLLQLIEQLEGPAKVQQMELFLERFPYHVSVSWIYSYLQDHYVKAAEPAKALAAGEKLFALHPDDLEAAVLNQKLAEELKDPKGIGKWQAAVNESAQKLLGITKPFYVTQEEWDRRLEYAGALIAQSEYEIFKKAVDAETPEEKIKLFDQLTIKNPKSLYVVQSWPHLLRAYRAIGSIDRALGIAEKILQKDADNEDALLTIAQVSVERRKDYPRVIAVSNRLLTLGQTTRKPEGLSQQDWDNRRGFYVGAAYQLLGSTHVYQNNFPLADKYFRAALPYIKGNPQAEGSVLFYIGWSNYYMENYKEAATFFKACMAISGPFAAQATKQLDGMRRERRIAED